MIRFLFFCLLLGIGWGLFVRCVSGFLVFVCFGVGYMYCFLGGCFVWGRLGIVVFFGLVFYYVFGYRCWFARFFVGFFSLGWLVLSSGICLFDLVCAIDMWVLVGYCDGVLFGRSVVVWFDWDF